MLLGVLATPLPDRRHRAGFHGRRRELTIRLVRILFPGAGLLVLSAWCLGILNSHRKFFLSYTAPVIWNLAMIATMLVFGRRMDTQRAGDHAGVGLGGRQRAAVRGAVAGGAAAGAAACPLGLSRRTCARCCAISCRSFVSRGVVQISAYVDAWLASFAGHRRGGGD